MKQLLDHIGISRQALHQGYRRMIERQGHVLQTCELADQVRQHHPGMNCRDVYWCMAGQMPRGRDWTEQILLEQGFGVKARARSFTQAGEAYVANLIEGLHVSGVNQLWQTDITYVWSGRRWHYVSFIIDVYSRQLLASHCSKDLSSKSQIACLQKAVKAAGSADLSGLIVHTDRGVQYTSSVQKLVKGPPDPAEYGTLCLGECVLRTGASYHQSQLPEALPA
jgi:putative transposase